MTTNNMLTRDAILKVEDLTRVKVDVPEWGGKVWVRMLSASEKAELRMGLEGDKREEAMRTLIERVVVLTIVDADGKHLFGADDVVALGRKSSQALERVFDAASRLSGLSEEDSSQIKKDSPKVKATVSGSRSRSPAATPVCDTCSAKSTRAN